MYVYLKYLRGEELWTVGFYDPDGKWHAESDHDAPDKAAARVNYLNGGQAVDGAFRKILSGAHG